MNLTLRLRLELNLEVDDTGTITQLRLRVLDARHPPLDLFTQSIETLSLSTRSRNALLKGGINTIGDLVKLSGRRLVNEYKYFGKKSVAEIDEALRKLGLSLAEK